MGPPGRRQDDEDDDDGGGNAAGGVKKRSYRAVSGRNDKEQKERTDHGEGEV